MARLHSAQTSPVAEQDFSFPPQISPPLQVRRRDSRESLLLAKQQSDPMLHASRRNGPPSLSITIPSPDKEKHKENATAATMRKDASQPRPPPPQEHDDDDDDGDITPREKTVTFSPPVLGVVVEGDVSVVVWCFV